MLADVSKFLVCMPRRSKWVGDLCECKPEGRHQQTLAIYDSIMENNVATDAVSNTCGGGIASGPGVTSVTLDNVTMANNKADKGGSVCILGRCKISISSSSFRNSTGRYRH